MTAEDRFWDAQQGRLHARVLGRRGPAVILIHGVHPANTWRVWQHNLETVAQAGCRAYALDLIGYGESERPAERPGHEAQAQAILEMMDQEGLDDATLVGVSWGGTIALALALAAPQRVAALMLVASGSRFSRDELAAIRCPTLVVWGEDDIVIPVESGYRLAAAIPGARLETIADATEAPDAPPWAGHQPMRFRPEAFNPILYGFLKQALPCRAE